LICAKSFLKIFRVFQKKLFARRLERGRLFFRKNVFLVLLNINVIYEKIKFKSYLLLLNFEHIKVLIKKKEANLLERKGLTYTFRLN